MQIHKQVITRTYDVIEQDPEKTGTYYTYRIEIFFDETDKRWGYNHYFLAHLQNALELHARYNEMKNLVAMNSLFLPITTKDYFNTQEEAERNADELTHYYTVNKFFKGLQKPRTGVAGFLENLGL